MHLMLDCDCVLSDFVGACYDVVESLGHPRPTLEDTTSFHIEECAWYRGCVAADRAFPKCFWHALRQPGVAASMRPTPQAADLLALVQALGCDVTVCTAPLPRSPTWLQERAAWLAINFPVVAAVAPGAHPAEAGPAHGAIVFDSRKYRYHADLFVDDHEENCRQWQAAHPEGTAVLWRTGHTRGTPGFPTAGTAIELAALIAVCAPPGPLEEKALDWASSERLIRAARPTLPATCLPEHH